MLFRCNFSEESQFVKEKKSCSTKKKKPTAKHCETG